MYRDVAKVSASSLEQAFAKAQNFNEEYAANNIRSTSVGDILVEDINGHIRCMMVRGFGFKEVQTPSMIFGYIANHFD
jgi:hypothetical protein